jgi:hypothetical protein
MTQAALGLRLIRLLLRVNSHSTGSRALFQA